MEGISHYSSTNKASQRTCYFKHTPYTIFVCTYHKDKYIHRSKRTEEVPTLGRTLTKVIYAKDYQKTGLWYSSLATQASQLQPLATQASQLKPRNSIICRETMLYKRTMDRQNPLLTE